MEERHAEANANVDTSAPPSVAQLAGRFREQAAAAKEIPAGKPARRKPPCSLPLLPPRVELGQNGEAKSPPNSGHLPKVKVKSSPLIEKLQANLAFAPAALLPGASPKSPGLKAVVSPFHSPPSTPSSPGGRPRSGEPEGAPLSFDQPPEGSHLPCYNKVRTRGSIKRRPPSRRFRRSQSDCGELGDFRAPEPSQENGAQEDAGDEVFPPKNKAPGSPPPGQGATLGSPEKPPLRRTSSRVEKQEGKAQAPEEAPKPEEAPGGAKEGAAEPRPATSTEAENGGGSPSKGRPAAQQEGSELEAKEEGAGSEREPAPPSRDAKQPEEGAAAQETPPTPAGGVESGLTSEEGKGREKQEEDTAPEPGCQPRTGSEAPETEDGTSA